MRFRAEPLCRKIHRSETDEPIHELGNGWAGTKGIWIYHVRRSPGNHVTTCQIGVFQMNHARQAAE